MKYSKDPAYTKAVAERLRRIMEMTGLELAGFAIFIEKSESHLYSLLNGRREVTTALATTLGTKLGFDPVKLFRISHALPENIRNAQALQRFREEHADNPEYFTRNKSERSFSYFLENELLPTPLFEEPRYVWEVSEICGSMGRPIGSDALSKHLKYLVTKKKLLSKKVPIKLRNGSYGKRSVEIFFKEKK